MKVNILEAKSQLSRLIKSAQAGEEVVIANRGEPVARLVATGSNTATANVGSKRNFLKWLDNNPLPVYAQRSAAEIDAAIELERNAWD
jgi:prevent-host-death family protein